MGFFLNPAKNYSLFSAEFSSTEILDSKVILKLSNFCIEANSLTFDVLLQLLRHNRTHIHNVERQERISLIFQHELKIGNILASYGQVNIATFPIGSAGAGTKQHHTTQFTLLCELNDLL